MSWKPITKHPSKRTRGPGYHLPAYEITPLGTENVQLRAVNRMLQGIIRAAYLHQLGRLGEHDQRKLGRDLATYGVSQD